LQQWTTIKDNQNGWAQWMGTMDDKRKLLEIKQYKNGSFAYKTDVIVREQEITIYINGERLTSLAALPENIPELTTGYLFSEGLIKSRTELEALNYQPGSREIEVKAEIPEERLYSYKLTGTQTSGCGSALSSTRLDMETSENNFQFDPQELLDLMLEFQKQSDLFRQTGGVHSAALVKDGSILFHLSDIGRHNAVDKVAGKAIMDEIDLSKCYLLSSGRISSEIMRKIIRLNIPLIVSHSAPTSEAVRLAWKYKTQIIGFARGGRFNQYTWWENSDEV